MTPSPTLILVEELERLAKEATPGEWEAILPGDDRGQPACTYRGLISLMSTDPAVAVVAKSGLSDPNSWQGNAALIVSLRNNLPAILSAMRRVEKLAGFTGHVARLFDSEEQGGKIDPQDAIETLDGLISLARSAINEGFPS